MKKYVSIAVGATPETAEAVFVTEDQELIEFFLACVLQRLEMLETPVPSAVYAH